MTDKYRQLDQKLVEISRSLDESSSMIRELALNPEVNIRRVGEALAAIFEVQADIYRAEPSLEPKYLKESPAWGESGRKLTTIMATSVQLEAEGRVAEALALHEAFVNEPHPQFLVEIARAEAEKIRKRMST